jgi:hypothetical protein
MANKRMFSLNVVDTDKFLEMPISSRLLYYELGMRADDDGFVSNWKKILLFTGLKEDDMKVLIAKQFIIPFESGVIVIRHWRLNNYLQNDRIKPTIYQKEFKSLGIDNNNVYTMDTTCIHSIDKNSIDKNSIEEKEIYKEKETKKKYGEFNNVTLTEEEYHKLEQANLLPYIEKLSSYIASKGKRYKSHYATILTWNRGDKNNKKEQPLPEWFDKEIEEDVSDEAKIIAERIRKHHREQEEFES